MKSVGARMRGGFAAILSAALVVSGAALAAPAAYAEEPTDAPVAVAAQATLPVEQPAEEAPAAEAPATEPAGAPAAAEAPADAPAEAEAAPVEGDAGVQPAGTQTAGTQAPESLASGIPTLGIQTLEAEPVWTPAISVTLKDGTPLFTGATVYKNDVIVVNGSGFDPHSHPRPANGRPPVTEGDPTGNYVVFGNFGASWQPSAGAASTQRSVGDQRWAMTDATFGNLAPNYVNGVRGQRIELATDGTFEAELTAKAASASPGSYGIYTFVAGGGANDAAQELALRLSYVDTERPVTWTPSITVFAADGVTELAPGTPVYDGDTVIVRGTGFQPDANIGTRPPLSGRPAGVYAVLGNFSENWRPSASNPSSTRSVVDQKWAIPLASSLGSAVENNAQRILMTDNGTFEASFTIAEPVGNLANGRLGVYTYPGSGAVNAEHELGFVFNYRGERPSIQVFKADGETPVGADALYAGDTIVVKGSGFDPASNPSTRPPITVGDPAGNYVVFGNFAENWRPSSPGTSADDRVAAVQRWALTDASFNNIVPRYAAAVSGQRVVMNTDGTFEFPIELADTAADKTAPAGGSYGLFTYVAGGAAADPLQELEVRLNYQGERPAEPVFEPELKVFLEDGTTPYANQQLSAGDTLVVKGSGFDPAANVPGGSGGVPIPKSLPQGTFVVFGSFAENWKPSTGAQSTQRTMHASNRGWALDPAVLDQVPSQYQNAIRTGGYVPLDADGNFTWTVTLTEPLTPLENGRWGIYSYAGGASGLTNASQELSVPLNFRSAAEGTGDDERAEGGLLWAFKDSWASYVTNIAHGSIVVSGGATKGAGNVIGFQQVSENFNTATGRGNILYQGTVNYVSADHGFSIALKDPWITVTADGTTLTAEVSTSDTVGTSSMTRVIVADLQTTTPSEDADGVLTWSNVSGVFADSVRPETWRSEYAGSSITPVTFSLGENVSGEIDPEEPPVVIPPITPPVVTPPPAPSTPAQAAGSLNWGVSSGFAAYTTGSIAKGTISTNGVGVNGSSYTFPQAVGGSWNAATQTGTVQYSGVVTFSGHGGLMRETFANPVITVSDAVAGTISAGGHTFVLNLAGATKTVGAGGEVTFSGVSVIGAISGGGSSGAGTGGGSFAVDPLSFTVGVASTVNYGTTAVSNPSLNRQPAATVPATAGVTVVTSDDELVEGGEVEITAAGFEPNETGILVVIYSEPTVLDTNARADANGVVRWIGTLPDGLSGEHTITLQGSINAGKVVRIQTKQEFAAAQAAQAERATTAARTMAAESEQLEAAGAAPSGGEMTWAWWVGALALVLVAGAMTAVVVARRRNPQN